MSVGYDNLDINHNMVLDLAFRDGVAASTIVRDESKSRYAFTKTGLPAPYTLPGSGLQVMDFTLATPDFLEAAIAAVPNLDFTSEDFSYAGWLDPSNLAGDCIVFCHGQAIVDGFYMRILANGSVNFESNQAAAAQHVISTAGDVAINTHQLVGISRSGVLLQIFVNGVEVIYTTQDDIVDPLTSAEKFLFGVYRDEVTDAWGQYMGRQRLWLNRQLSVSDHRFIWETERNKYGV